MTICEPVSKWIATVQNGSFGDSVMPVVEAGLVQFYRAGDVITELELEVFDGAGHTPGQSGLTLRRAGRTLIFTADIFHSPIQVHYPEINSRWCELPDKARRTRYDVLQRAIEPGAVVMPAHSFTIDGWKISRDGNGFTVAIGD